MHGCTVRTTRPSDAFVFRCRTVFVRSGNLQRSRDDGSRVDKKLSVDVLHDAEIFVQVIHVHLAGRGTSLVPGKQLPNGSHRNLDLPDDIPQQWQAIQSLDLAGGRVVYFHVQARDRSVSKDVLFQGGAAGRGRDDASPKGRQELEPTQYGNDRQGEERCVEGTVEVPGGRVDVLSDPTDLGHSPRAGLQLVQLEKQCRFARPVLECFCLRVFVGFLYCQKEGGAAKNSVGDRRQDQFPFSVHVPEGLGKVFSACVFAFPFASCRNIQELVDLVTCNVHVFFVVGSRGRIVGLSAIQCGSQLQELDLELLLNARDGIGSRSFGDRRKPRGIRRCRRCSHCNRRFSRRGRCGRWCRRPCHTL
mmetsp:Transcript_25988/g.71291  ORF Transcript_25988/g.71291 Transcript_25988/m.71291 type:complete len:361 (-) Transcript_25988:223-1305(-)